MNAIRWKTFLGGLACGLLIGAGGVYCLNQHSRFQNTTASRLPDFASLKPVEEPIAASSAFAKAGSSTELRTTDSACDPPTVQEALELKRAGWTYIMPEPKSSQAAWGNRDGRTTWWVGYWINQRENSSSSAQPAKAANGRLVGDGKGFRYWRRGGSPRPPSEIEWLCSSSGGIPPS